MTSRWTKNQSLRSVVVLAAVAMQTNNDPFVLAASPTRAKGRYPACEACGCSFCDGSYTMANPDATFLIPEKYKRDLFNLPSIGCGAIQAVGLNGDIPPQLCNDDIRLYEDFRKTCGCPPAGSVMASDVPSDMPITELVTESPPTAVPTGTPSPTLSFQKCDICGCPTCADGQSVTKKDAVFTVPVDLSLWFQGFEEVGCVDLEDLARNGVFQEIDFICSDDFRLRPDFRTACGCEVAEVGLSPTSAPQTTIAPVTTSTYYDCNICGEDDSRRVTERGAVYEFKTPILIQSQEFTYELKLEQCGLLEDVAFQGGIDDLHKFLCSDELRLDPDFISTCGCGSEETDDDNEEETDDGEKPIKKSKARKKQTVETDDTPPTMDDDGTGEGDDRPTKTKNEKPEKTSDDDDDQPGGGGKDYGEKQDGEKEDGEKVDSEKDDGAGGKEQGGKVKQSTTKGEGTKLIRRKPL